MNDEEKKVAAEKLSLIRKARETLSEARRYVTTDSCLCYSLLTDASDAIDDAMGGMSAEADLEGDRLCDNLFDAGDFILSAPDATRAYIDGVRQTLSVIEGRISKAL